MTMDYFLSPPTYWSSLPLARFRETILVPCLDEGPPVTQQNPFILIICLPKMYKIINSIK